MPKSGPIVIVEDDIDDQEIMEGALRELDIRNEIVFLNNGDEGLSYLKGNYKKQPFLILCDINMPGMNGLELKRQIDSDPELRRKSIPFIFLTTSSSRVAINLVYKEMTTQGFFIKPSDYNELKTLLKLIMDYWMHCKHPHSDK